MRWLLLACLISTFCGCPDSRPPPRPAVEDDEPTEDVAEPVAPAQPATLEGLQAEFETRRDAFHAAPTAASWEAAIASLDALQDLAQQRFDEEGGYDAEELSEEAEAALEILEDYEPVERDELVRARPANQDEEPADAGSKESR